MKSKETKERVAPLWHKILITVCAGSMLTFSALIAMDMESTLGWGYPSLETPVTGEPTQTTTTTTAAAAAATTTTTTTGSHHHRHGHNRKTTPTPVELNDPSCLARAQHLLYRKDPDRFAPTPQFQTAWKRYEELHRACTQGKNMTHAFLYERDQKPDDCSYLVVMEGSGGLGNKLLSLTSAFAYALATERVVLVEGRNQFKDLLCEPFPDSSWFLPVEFPYVNVSQAPGLNVAIDADYTDVNLVNLHLDHIQSWADSQFFCDHTHFKLANVLWVGWTSNQYYATSLFMIPSVWERLNPLFKPNQVFAQLSHKILLPKNELWAHIVRLYWGYLAGSGTRVGLQIRLHGRENLAEYDQNVFTRILDCLHNNKVLPKLQEEDKTDPMALFLNQLEGGKKENTDISVLVASLQSQYYDEIKDLYAANPNSENRVVRFHMVSHLGVQDGSRHQSQIAFVEMWLLSFSDVLVISAYSTFGYVPQGLGGLNAYVLNIRGDIKDTDQESCMINHTAEPCTHFPMKPTCTGSNASEIHSGWMRHHLRECLDHDGGLQLVVEAPQPNNSTRLWEHDH